MLGQTPRTVIADLVGETRDTEGRSLEVLIHPEIQMKTDADIGWRVLQYNAGLTLQQASRNARVLTLVFYHCRGAGGIQKRRFTLDFYGEPLLEVGYWSVGLGDLDAERYAESEIPIAWALASWMKQRRESRVRLRLRLQEKILRSVEDVPYRRLLLNAVRTYFKLNGAEQRQEEELLRSEEFGKGVSEMFEQYLHTELGKLESDAKNQGLQEGLNRGLQEGLNRGLQEGLNRGRQDALLTLLRSRFSGIPNEVIASIQNLTDPDSLDALIRRAATAASLEEVGVPWISRD